MSKATDLNFDLLVEPRGDRYQARVTQSPAGEAATEFLPPPSKGEWSNGAAIGAFGGALFDALFRDEVRSCLRRSLDEARRQGGRLRLRLRLADVPELAALPWEYLHDPINDRFFALSVQTPIVRYLDLPQRATRLSIELPLNVLVMVASPVDLMPLDAEAEWARLNNALSDLQARNLVALHRLEDARLTTLQERLRHQTCHVFHFIGHGDFDEQTQDGLLMLENESNRSHRVSGQMLGTVLRDHAPLRLATLNACEGARASRSDPFAGVAQRLVQQGIPAVIAMQFQLSDDAAQTFAPAFYAAVADGYPVDAAVTESRKAIYAGGNADEWGTPVLYMRSPDGLLFDVPARPGPSPPQRTVSTHRPATKELQTYRRELAALRAQLERRQVALFVGADLPQEITGLPGRQALADGLAAQEGIAPGGRLASVAQQVMNAGFRHSFTQFILNTLDATARSPSAFHRAAVDLVSAYQIETTITTAYDHLLEQAFQGAGTPVNLVVRESNLDFINPDRPTLIQLYGAARQQDTLVVTEQDQNALLRGRAKGELIREAQIAFRRNTVLFVGYDLSDPIVSALFDEMAGGRFQRRSFAVWSDLSEREAASLESNRNLTVLRADPVSVLRTLLPNQETARA
jgi:hypothetical protein